VDGAHAPAHIPLDLSTIQADFYTGACHKWMMAPKGCSFLYAAKSVQPICDPMIVSWGYQAAKPSHSNFLDYHQMIGTRDFSAFLTVDTCIQFMEQHDWKAVGRKCHDMVLAHAPRFFSLLHSTPISPLNSEWIGQMISIPIQTPDPEKLQRTLFLDYKIEVPIMRQSNDVYLRYSINAFNTVENLDALYNALVEIQKEGILLT
jgi:isopenicillin-N epimerase